MGRVDQRERTHTPSPRDEGMHIRDKAGCEGHAREGDHPGPFIHRLYHRDHWHTPTFRRNAADLDALKPLEVVPEIDVVGVLEFGTQDYVVALPPRETSGEEVQALGDVLGDRDLVGIGANQVGHGGAGLIDPRTQEVLVARSEHTGVEVLGDRLPHGLRHKSPGRYVQVDLIARPGKECSQLGIHVDRSE